MQPNNDALAALQARLAEHGFNRSAWLEQRHAGVDLSSRSDGTLLLVGNSGPRMWELMPPQWFDSTNPVDEHSVAVVSDALAECLPGCAFEVLYPSSEYMPSLQSLGALAGWHADSPLGMGINATDGLWFAYRTLLWVDVDVAATAGQQPRAQSPCLSCTTLACVTACPAEAVHVGQAPDLSRCMDHRLQPVSACASNCLARRACPVAAEKRYTEPQMRYHYQRSLTSLKRWMQTTNND